MMTTTDPTREEQLEIERLFFNYQLRKAAGYVHATEVTQPNAEMNRILRSHRNTEPEPQEEND